MEFILRGVKCGCFIEFSRSDILWAFHTLAQNVGSRLNTCIIDIPIVSIPMCSSFIQNGPKIVV